MWSPSASGSDTWGAGWLGSIVNWMTSFARMGNESSSDQPDVLEKMNILSQRDAGQTLNQPGWDAETGNQSKKKSRRHQRYLKRRAQELQIVMPPQKHFSTFCTDVSIPSIGQARQPSSSHPLQNMLTCPSIATKNRGSLPHLMLQKPAKCVAIDCEMVGTGPCGKTSELARCTVVSYDGDVIYDKYVLPELPVVDYRTRWSGITWKHLRTAIYFQVAQKEIVQVLKDKIVVGHALHNDFRALKYFHPREWTRDTSQCPLLKKKIALSPNHSMSLKNLATQLLHRKIQDGKGGHSSVEDAQASMELYRLVEFQWEQLLVRSLPLGRSDPAVDGDTDNRCYMDDQYWPQDLDIDCK